MSTLTDWINSSPERQAGYAQEALIVDVTEEIWGRMKEIGFDKRELAKYLKCSRSNVTQMLNGQRNLGLRKLAEICEILGVRPVIKLVPKQACKDCPHKVQGQIFERDCAYPECAS